MTSLPPDLNPLLPELEKGEADSTSKLIPQLYQELRKLAAYHLRHEQPGHTLQPTALVHEAYLKLVRQDGVSWESRTHFFGVASQLMREILVDHARKRQSLKRGGFQQKVLIEDTVAFAPQKTIELLALDEALKGLEQLDPQQVRVVELRFFGGLSVEDTATVLGISTRTVKREWKLARVWLHRAIYGEPHR